MPSSGRLPARLVEMVRAQAPTPFFYMDLCALRERLEALLAECEAFGASYSYPVKANCSVEVLELMRGAGVSLDLCSAEELDTALACGFEPGRLTMCGAGFGELELERVLESGVDLDLDSLDELETVSRLAPGVEVGIRVAPRLRTQRGPSGRYAWKFGLTVEDLPTLQSMVSQGRVVVSALHFHGLYPVEAPASELRELLTNILSFAPGVRRINFGGGWGDGLSEDWLLSARGHMQTCVGLAKELGVEQAVFEPGEALIGPAGWLVTRVRALKKRDLGELVAICDTPYTTSVGTGLVSSVYPVTLVGPDQGHERVLCSLYGRNNTPHDVICAAVRLPRPRVGAALAVGGQGAYVPWLLGRFNSRPVPELTFSDGSEGLLRSQPPLLVGTRTETKREKY